MTSTALNTSIGNSPVSDDTGARRPLYIIAKDHIQIRSSGDFLVVQQCGHNARHFAVTRLDRVICNSKVDWSGAALTLCLQHRVTISWLTGKSELLGYCMPLMPHTEAMHACMEKFAALPTAAARWDNWFRHRRMHVLSTWAEGRDETGKPVPDQLFREQKRCFVYMDQPPHQLDTELLGPFQSIIVARLSYEGVQCTYHGRNGVILNLLAQLTLLLWGEINLAAGGFGMTIADRRIEWQFLESWQKEHAATLDEHIVTLKLFLGRTLKACL